MSLWVVFFSFFFLSLIIMILIFSAVKGLNISFFEVLAAFRKLDCAGIKTPGTTPQQYAQIWLGCSRTWLPAAWSAHEQGPHWGRWSRDFPCARFAPPWSIGSTFCAFPRASDLPWTRFFWSSSAFVLFGALVQLDHMVQEFYHLETRCLRRCVSSEGSLVKR